MLFAPCEYMTYASNRVVHVCSVGIIARLFLTEHLRRQRLAGFDVVLMCYDDEDARYAAQASGVDYVPLAIKQGVAPFSGLISMIRLWWLLRRMRPAIFDAHGSKAGSVGIPVSWLARIPVRIYHNHGMALLSSTGLRRSFFKIVEAIACNFATRVIYVAPSNMEDAIDAGG